MNFQVPFIHNGIWKDDTINSTALNSTDGKNLKAYFQFGKMDKPLVMVKVALSGVSIEGAKRNMKSEMPGWNYAQVAEEAQKKWNRELSKIEVSAMI